MRAEGFTVKTAAHFYDCTEFVFEKNGREASYKLTRQNNKIDRIKACVEVAKSTWRTKEGVI